MGKIPLSLKILLAILLFCVSIFLFFYFLKTTFPNDYAVHENNTKISLVKKFPILSRVISIPKPKPLPVKKVFEDEKPLPEKEEFDFFKNEDIYRVICGEDKLIKPKDKFIGCNHCPSYLEKGNKDYFSMSSYAMGSIIKKNETEAIFFMRGCLDEDNSIAIVLRKEFNGWQKVSQFKNISFDSSPLIFHDSQNFLVFVGKKEVGDNDIKKDTLFSVTFKNNKMKSNDIFVTHYAYGLKCAHQFIAGMSELELKSEHEFTLQLDVLGWQETENSECKFKTPHPKVSLKSQLYNLHFTQRDDAFFGDKSTQKVMTEIEKAQE